MKYQGYALLLMVSLLCTLPRCTTLTSEPEISMTGRHSFAPGFSQRDREVVMKILKLNHLDYSIFDSVSFFGDDLRLHRLMLSNRGIDTLPDEIGELTQLELLDLNNNRLTSLPDKICAIPPCHYVTKTLYQQGHGGSTYQSLVGSIRIDNNYLSSVSSKVGAWLDSSYAHHEYPYPNQWRPTQRSATSVPQ